MKLKAVELRNLVTFKCARISALSITFTDTTQLILGTNGSGKSNLLRQLSPLPAGRNDYGPSGYKKLVLEHGGVEYILISDFSRKDSPHEFWEAGINLNEGGTTEVQRELVIDKLGWTPAVEALCFNSYNYTTMTASLRQVWFSKINPYKINFILENAKKAKTRIRNCKAILSRLQERKVLLENQLISLDALKLLRDEHSQLLDQSDFLNRTIIKIDTILSTTKLPEVTRLGIGSVQDDLQQLVKETKSLMQTSWLTMRKCRFVNRDDPAAQLQSLLMEQATVKSRYDAGVEKLNELYESRRRDESNLEDCVEEEVLQRLNSELMSLQTELDSLIAESAEEPFPETLLTQKESVLGSLRSILDKFIDGPHSLMSRKTFHRKHRALARWKSYRDELQRTLRSSAARIDAWNKTLTLKLSDIPDQPCAKMQCPLFVSFKTSHDTTLNNIVTEQAYVDSVTAKHKQLDVYLDAQSKQLSEMAPYQELLGTLFDLLQSYPALHQFFARPDTLDRIARSSRSLYNQIENHFVASEKAYRVPKVKEKLLKAQMDYAQHKTLSGKEKDHLTSMLKETDAQISKITGELRGYRDRLEELQGACRTIEQYLELKTSLTERAGAMTERLAYCEKEHDLNKLRDLRRMLQADVRSKTQRVADIQKTLQEQDSLHDRLDTEVLGEIHAMETEKEKFEAIGEALDALPQEYTMMFMNALYNSANAFIAKVFTYKLALDPMTEDLCKNYRIPYKARTTDSPDISKCSTAQAEIINLALTLACRQSEGLSDYPLFLDEVGKNFDPTHQQRLLDLVLFITDEHLASQLFIVNHHAVIHGGLMNTETLVLDDSNILKTETYNTHAVMETY